MASYLKLMRHGVDIVISTVAGMLLWTFWADFVLSQTDWKLSFFSAKEINAFIKPDGTTHQDSNKIEVFVAKSVEYNDHNVPVQNSSHSRRWILKVHNESQVTVTRILWNFFPLMEVQVFSELIPGTSRRSGLIVADKSYNHLNHPKFLLSIPPGTHLFHIEAKQHGVHAAYLWQLTSPEAYSRLMRTLELSTAVFLGVFAIVWVYNQIFFLLVGQREYSFYGVSGLGLILCFVVLVGMPFDIPPYWVMNSIRFLPIFSAICLSALWVFFLIFFNINPQNQKNYYVAITINVLILIISGAASTVFTRDSSSRFLWLLCLQFFCITFFLVRFRNHLNSRFWRVFFAANICQVFAVLSVNLMYLGLMPFDVRIFYVPFGGSILLLKLLTLIVGYYAKDQNEEKIDLETSIHLGRSVQNLLLPKEMAGNIKKIEYHFIYRPYASQMSGDWLHHWVCQDGSQHFILGDVTGKGPQAALAVAMIMSIVDRAAFLNYKASECLHEINVCLFEMFQGKILTTASAVSLDQNGHGELYNAGGLGWYLAAHKNGIQHFLSRASILGFNATLTLRCESVQLQPQDLLLTLTDGFGDQSRSLRRMSLEMSKWLKSSESPKALIKRILESHIEANDDQAMIVIKDVRQPLIATKIAA